MLSLRNTVSRHQESEIEMIARYCLLFILGLYWPVVTQRASIIYPEQANVSDVTQPPYSADNTGRRDVSMILSKALLDASEDNHTVYLPNGTYLIG